jgi:hypothetical protein
VFLGGNSQGKIPGVSLQLQRTTQIFSWGRWSLRACQYIFIRFRNFVVMASLPDLNINRRRLRPQKEVLGTMIHARVQLINAPGVGTDNIIYVKHTH